TAALEVWPFSVDRPASERVGAPFVLVGYTLEKHAVSASVRLADGEDSSVPISWVTPPIDAGFFVVWGPKAHWTDRGERVQVTTRDETGSALGTTAIEVGSPTP